MSDGITVRILGDYGPFSRMGKSIGYQVVIGESSYLIDCGSPLFQQIGGHGLKEVRGLIITHCHDDHKRWFTDLALFNMYAPDIPHKVTLITSEDNNAELVKSSACALDRSLSIDSKRIIDVAYEDYIDYRGIGPRAKYRIVPTDEGHGRTGLCITDRSGDLVGPDKAKIVISSKSKRPRLLFRDPVYDEWVEPESFYSFASDLFYEKDKNLFIDEGEGVTIEAIKAPVWHGVPSIGIKISTGKETLIFSSDTVNDKELWKQLYTEKRTQRIKMTKKEFEAAGIIYGDINDYIERTWSEGRYKDAVCAFDDAVVIHDIAVRNSVVHTDYRKLGNAVLNRDKVILTHSPDRMTSEWVLSNAGKLFMVKGDSFFEVAGDALYPLNADIYHKEEGKYYVGYRHERGGHTIYEKDGILGLARDGAESYGTPLYKVELYEDISGRYFPKLEHNNAMYVERHDGRVELVEFSDHGSKGVIVEDQRERLSAVGCRP